jgi:GMP synthase (glutamine-hydrolysing)
MGGYSQDRMSTRIDTTAGDVTGPKLACLHHLESPFLGAAAAPLRAARLEHYDLLQGDPLPDLGEIDGLISFGGAQSVTEIDRYPYLLEEAELLRRAVERDVPVLGVCLGAQVLAHALGGSVRRLPRRAVTWLELARIADDELVPDPVWALHWNEDAIEPPPGASELLERGGLGCAAFRAGSAWGIQFHADVDAPVLDSWYERYGDWLAPAEVDPAAARAADAEHLPGQPQTAEAIFGGFVTRARAARTRGPR